MILRDTTVDVAVGTILLLTLSRFVGRVQFSLSAAFWCSFIGHIFGALISIPIGFAFSRHMTFGLISLLAVGCAFQTVLLKIAIRAKNGNLTTWRALILSLIVLLGDFLVASPLH
jgi:hypothetical protein